MTSPTVTADRELLDLTMVRLIAAIGVGRVSVDLAKDAVSRLSELDMELGAARLRIDELLRARSALADVGAVVSLRDFDAMEARAIAAERKIDALADVGECETCGGRPTHGDFSAACPCPRCTAKQPRPFTVEK